MPVYSYSCKHCELVTQMVRPIADRDLTVICLDCQLPMQRIIEATPVHFKGSGFYATDR